MLDLIVKAVGGFPQPAAFDFPWHRWIDRSRNPRMSSAVGIHRCLGAPLAKVEFDILAVRT
ncbi:MAG TPA: hypothetical protein VHM48_11905 [Candidatus Limnocylindrales bacterium]|nr:hypothetical protein [Candidatus Limnocylindrales bacterium]